MIIVYQFGKVGSTAITKNITEANPSDGCYWGHWLGSEYQDKVSSLITPEPHDDVTMWDKSRLSTLLDVEDRLMTRFQQAVADDEALKFIVGVRDPIDRSVSLLFQLMHYITPIYDGLDDADGAWLKVLSSLLDKIWLGSESDLKSCGRIGELLHMFIHMPETWFETEFEPYTGMDIHASQSQLSGKYCIGDGVSAFFYRFEDGRERISAGVSEYLQLLPISSGISNAVSKKRTARLHDRFRKHYKPSSEVSEYALSRSWLTRFYSNSEIAAMKIKWS